MDGWKRRAGREQSPPPPFLFRVLLAAEGPFGLDVDVKPEGRVVGVWSIDVNLRDPGGSCVSQARGNLYVCASVTGDERATGAFLVVRHWRVDDGALAQSDALYDSLSAAVLERLDALMGAAASEERESTSCVLYLVDGRRFSRKRLSLDTLQARFLRDIEGDRAIAGIDLRIAHGRGTGVSANRSSTLPAALSGDSVPPTAQPDAGFVAETVSPVNALWNRRATDKARTLAAAAAAKEKKSASS